MSPSLIANIYVHLFNKCVLIIYCVPGIFLSAEDIAGNRQKQTKQKTKTKSLPS